MRPPREARLNDAIDPNNLLRESNSTEFHLPGYNYLGPGTHVVSNIKQHVMPTTRADAVAMIHDIEYLIATNNESKLKRADKHAIDQAKGFTPDVLLLKTGLTLRSSLHLPLQVETTPEKITETQRAGLELRRAVLADPQYQNIMQLYDVQFQKEDDPLQQILDNMGRGKS